MGLSSLQNQAARNQSSGMVREVVVPSGPNFSGNDFSVLSPDDKRAQDYLKHLAHRNISAAERKPS